jgi:hypothetical protein
LLVVAVFGGSATFEARFFSDDLGGETLEASEFGAEGRDTSARVATGCEIAGAVGLDLAFSSVALAQPVVQIKSPADNPNIKTGLNPLTAFRMNSLLRSGFARCGIAVFFGPASLTRQSPRSVYIDLAESSQHLVSTSVIFLPCCRG